MANAFEIYAFDYLVKPFDMSRIGKTLDRIKSMSVEKAEVEKAEHQYEKLIIRGKEEINLVDLDDIIMIERNDGMSRIVTNEEVFLTSQSHQSLEEKHDPQKFIRCH